MQSLGMVVFAVVAAAGAAAACGGAAAESLMGGGPAGGDDVSTTLPSGGGADAGGGINATGKGAGSGAPTGLPCDVQQLLENRCIGCHLGPSPVALLTFDDLVKPSAGDPTKTLADVSLARMKNTAAPMPPAPAVAPTAAEIAVLDAWIKAGTTKGTACTSAPGDAGAGAGKPTNTPTVCTSNTTWKGGNDGSSRMKPGGACITCHSMQGGPSYDVAGTVYPTAHEPNDCNGVNGAMSVVVTDKNGVVTTLAVNTAGNFSSRGNIAAPFTVKVVSGGKERAMIGSVTAGDCNTCHTVAGLNGAPGRIMSP